MSEYEKLKPALQKLVDEDVLSAHQALAAQTALRVAGTPSQRSRRSLFSEALTYIGGAVVVISAGLLLNQTWQQLGTWGRPAVIFTGAAILFIVATLLSKSVKDETRRRLTSTLFVGSAALVAFAIGVLTNEFWVPKNDPQTMNWINPDPWVVPTIAILCSVAGGLIAGFGYFRAKSAFAALAQILASHVIAYALGALIWIQIFGEDEFPTLATFLLATSGAIWVYVAQRELLAEDSAVAFGGIAGLFFASQTLREQYAQWFPPTIEILGGLAFLALYMFGRKWPFLAAGIAGMLMGGVELLSIYVKGVTGALSSMALGIVLLILGTRLFKEHK